MQRPSSPPAAQAESVASEAGSAPSVGGDAMAAAASLPLAGAGDGSLAPSCEGSTGSVSPLPVRSSRGAGEGENEASSGRRHEEPPLTMLHQHVASLGITLAMPGGGAGVPPRSAYSGGDSANSTIAMRGQHGAAAAESESESDSITSPDAQHLGSGGAAGADAGAPRPLPAASDFGAQLAATRQTLAQRVAALSALHSETGARERGANAARRAAAAALGAEGTRCVELQAAVAAAADSEDFEAAASLSTELDAAQERAATLQQELRDAEAACSAAEGERVRIAQRQAAVHAEAVARVESLQAAQQRAVDALLAAAAEAAAAAAAARAAGEERVVNLRQCLEQQRTAAEERQAELDARQEQDAGGLRQLRTELASACEALQREIDALRCVRALVVLSTPRPTPAMRRTPHPLRYWRPACAEPS